MAYNRPGNESNFANLLKTIALVFAILLLFTSAFNLFKIRKFDHGFRIRATIERQWNIGGRSINGGRHATLSYVVFRNSIREACTARDVVIGGIFDSVEVGDELDVTYFGGPCDNIAPSAFKPDFDFCVYAGLASALFIGLWAFLTVPAWVNRRNQSELV